MKNNYPIKYAVIPILQNNNIICYIITKCYLVNENIDYEIDGSFNKTMQVVPVYSKDENDNWIINEPILNPSLKTCVNSYSVDNIYNNYEQAKYEKENKNKILLLSKLFAIPSSYDREYNQKLLTESFKNDLKYYNQIEEEILSNINKYQIKNNSYSHKTILVYDYVLKKSNTSIYTLINTYKDLNYKVYNISKQTYEKSNTITDLNNANNHLLLINNGESKISALYKGNNKLYIQNNVLIDHVDPSISFNSNCDYSFYTTETWQDIVNSYEHKSFTLKRTIDN